MTRTIALTIATALILAALAGPIGLSLALLAE